MQTPSIPGLTNLGAPASPGKTQNSSSSEPRFEQMLERQISQREASKPAEAPKPENRRQEAKAPVNSANSPNKNAAPNATLKSANSANAKQNQSATAASNAKTDKISEANSNTNTNELAKTESVDVKDSAAAATETDKKSSDATDTALDASAAIMALVANAGIIANQVGAATDRTAVAASTTDAAAKTLADAPRTAGNGTALDLAAKANDRNLDAFAANAVATETGPSQAGKTIGANADVFSAALQTANKSVQSEATQAAQIDLVDTGINTTQIAPQIQQATLDIAVPAGPHPGNLLAPRVGNENWNQALSQRMVWMVAGAEQSASLTLNPPDLGPMQVVLRVSNGQADASFFAAQPEVRQALEAALPKLREMLGDAGVSLGQTSVSAGQPQQQQASDQRSGNANKVGGATLNAAATTADNTSNGNSATRIIGGNGLVDTFA